MMKDIVDNLPIKLKDFPDFVKAVPPTFSINKIDSYRVVDMSAISALSSLLKKHPNCNQSEINSLLVPFLAAVFTFTNVSQQATGKIGSKINELIDTFSKSLTIVSELAAKASEDTFKTKQKLDSFQDYVHAMEKFKRLEIKSMLKNIQIGRAHV